MSAEMQAGIQGHAFLASWLANRRLDDALDAFDKAAHRAPHVTRPGWYSNSAMRLFQECEAKFYLSRTLGLRRVPIDQHPESIAKALDKQAKIVAQARDACIWLAESGNADGQGRFTTWATELYLETPLPLRQRMFIDELCWDNETDCLTVRDHKFTWKADARVAARMLYADQLPLYATSWNKLLWQWDNEHLWDRLPRVEQMATNVIVVSASGKHSVMPASTQALHDQKQVELWRRLVRDQEHAEAFEAQAAQNGWTYASQFKRTNSCVVFSLCPYAPICHHGAAPEAGEQYTTATDNPPEEEA